MSYITTLLLLLLLALRLPAAQRVSVSMPVTDEQEVSLESAEVPATFQSVLTNWGHFGQTDFPHSTQPSFKLATRQVDLAQVSTDASDSEAVHLCDEKILLRASNSPFTVALNGNSFINGD